MSNSTVPRSIQRVKLPSYKAGQRFNPFRQFGPAGIYIPESLCKYKGLSMGAKMAWGRLYRYCGKDGQVYPSVGSLGRELGVSGKQASTYVHELEAKKFLEVDYNNLHRRKDGSGGTPSYYFLWHPAFQGDLGEIRRQPRPHLPQKKTSGVPPQKTSALTPEEWKAESKEEAGIYQDL